MVDILWSLLGIIIVAAIFGIPQTVMVYIKDLIEGRRKHVLALAQEKRKTAEAELALKQLGQAGSSEPRYESGWR